MEFVTPTAFKVDGRYRNYPAVSNIFKSLINKHDSISEKTEFYSEELIEQIENGVEM
ncbi:MAG: CRISPR system precrRNA processing endoribonuclease RAMP protein Cas6 [Anaerovoracaceae bacterium]